MNTATAEVFSTEQLEERAAALIEKARAQVMMKHPLYASLLLRLKVQLSWAVKTMVTDGRFLIYNPSFVCKRTVESNAFVLAHEVTHCALGHPMRTRNKADKEVWNVACDHAVNLILKRDPRLAVPDDATCDDQFEGQSADWIYEFLMKKQQQEQEDELEQEAQKEKQDGEGEPSESEGKSQGDDKEEEKLGAGTEHGDVIEPGVLGDAEETEDAVDETEQEEGEKEEQGTEQGSEENDDADAGEDEDDDDDGSGDDANEELDDDEPGGESGPEEDDDGDRTNANTAREDADQASDEALAREWSEALSAAALAAGSEADEALEQRIREAIVPKRGFHDYLHQFLTERAQDHEDWSRRNRRFAEVFVASRGGFGTQGVLFAIDTSGSISPDMLASFAGTVQEVWAELALEHGFAVYCDAKIRRVDEFFGEPEFTTFPGGGGTLFAPVFKTYEQMIAEGTELTGIVYLTDQENFDIGVDALKQFDQIPTLWVNPGKAKEAPFGLVCSLLD